MRERVNVKSPVREYCSPGSVRGASGNRCPYLDMDGIGIGVTVLANAMLMALQRSAG
jgi:hypothetical protein